ncbi:hypothetical protein PVAP13_5NG446940 [Panicum virgatum]|uniref:Uncharacterized protein n=1 Tax=Panicum virgatum TaxID=38727 RepID=A0A8T0S2M7_PANVG|nr:hypothetical protein PVAP13_5NG446940 [Panicum virgatum]
MSLLSVHFLSPDEAGSHAHTTRYYLAQSDPLTRLLGRRSRVLLRGPTAPASSSLVVRALTLLPPKEPAVPRQAPEENAAGDLPGSPYGERWGKTQPLDEYFRRRSRAHSSETLPQDFLRNLKMVRQIRYLGKN